MDADQMRVRYGYRLVLAGLLITAALLLAVVFMGNEDAEGTVAIVGLFTSAFGTVVGGFFGVQVGASGKEKEREERQKTEKKLQVALSDMSPDRKQFVFDDWKAQSLW